MFRKAKSWILLRNDIVEQDYLDVLDQWIVLMLFGIEQ